jgi:hypothetical protein
MGKEGVYDKGLEAEPADGAFREADRPLEGDLHANGYEEEAPGGDHDAVVADGRGSATNRTCADGEAEDDLRARKGEDACQVL